MINDPDYPNHVEGVEWTYESLNDKSKVAADRNAIRKAEDNKMAAVTSINALNKSLSENKILKQKIHILKQKFVNIIFNTVNLMLMDWNVLIIRKINYKFTVHLVHQIHKNYYRCYKNQA